MHWGYMSFGVLINQLLGYGYILLFIPAFNQRRKQFIKTIYKKALFNKCDCVNSTIIYGLRLV